MESVGVAVEAGHASLAGILKQQPSTLAVSQSPMQLSSWALWRLSYALQIGQSQLPASCFSLCRPCHCAQSAEYRASSDALRWLRSSPPPCCISDRAISFWLAS